MTGTPGKPGARAAGRPATPWLCGRRAGRVRSAGPPPSPAFHSASSLCPCSLSLTSSCQALEKKQKQTLLFSSCLPGGTEPSPICWKINSHIKHMLCIPAAAVGLCFDSVCVQAAERARGGGGGQQGSQRTTPHSLGHRALPFASLRAGGPAAAPAVGEGRVGPSSLGAFEGCLKM